MFSFRKKIFLSVLLLTLIGGGLAYWQTAQGVNRTWDCGGGNASWDNDANWSGDTEPGVSDVAIFDGTCTNNVTIDKNISVAGISIGAAYSGIITQSSTFTVTVGSSHYSQAAGTFTGGSGAITINGTYTLSGGTFTSTSGTLSASYGALTNETLFTISGGTFNHNNGTVKFNPYGSSGNKTLTIDVNTNLTLYNCDIDDTGAFNDTITTASGDTIICTNSLTHSNGYIGGTWESQGNISIGSSAKGGTGTLTMTGTGSKTYTYSSGGRGPHLRINNASISVSAYSGTTSLEVAALTVLAGTFTAPSGTLTVGNITGAFSVLNTSSGATFNHNNGTVAFIGDISSHNLPHTVDANSTLTLYNVIVDMPLNSDALAAGSGDTITVANDFTYTASSGSGTGLTGTWEVQGNYAVGSGANGGTATINFTGGNNQIYTDSGGNEPDGDVTVNKTPGSSVRLASNADWNAASQDVTITSGELNMGTSYNISTTALTVSAAGHLSNNGTGDLTLAGNVSNSGNIRFMSSGTCGGTDSVSITSSSSGVQRTWSGTGTYLFHDVTVQDQGGSATITAYSSTSVSNNGGNWTFSGGACPAQPPAAGISTGKMNLQSGKFNLR